MKPNFKSIGWTVVSAGLFLSLLIGTQLLVKNYYMADRLEDKLINVNGVKKVLINNGKIELTLGRVDNIKTVYEDAEKQLDSKDFQIMLLDHPSKQLVEIADESEVALQEAMIRGNFTEMVEFINKLAAKSGVNARVFVDSKRIYLQLKSGDNSLYRVLDRPNYDGDVVSASTT